MIKKKFIDYIFGMITGASLMVAFWACTNTPLGASAAFFYPVIGITNIWNESI